MSGADEFVIRSSVTCTDGACGELQRLLVDTTARKLTHLVVKRHRGGAGRLVPVDLVCGAGTETRLSCSLSDFDALGAAEVTEALPESSVDWAYVQEQVGYGGGGPIYDLYTPPAGRPTVTHDVVPSGEDEVRYNDDVHASDGSIGRLLGLVADSADHRVTHVLVDAGHLFAHRRVAIPISAVRDVDTGIRLSLTKEEVAALPPFGA